MTARITTPSVHYSLTLALAAAMLATYGAPLAAGAAQTPAKAHGRPALRLDFESVPTGQLPPGWKAEATHPDGRPNAWAVQVHPQAASGQKVLILPKTPRFYGGTFNICWTDQTQFRDGVIEVKVHARTGNEDQGGGPIWRVKDANNYYIARWNPLEDNFRVYYVKNGHRRQLDSAHVRLDPKQWHTIRVRQEGSRITCFLDGKKMLAAEDTTFTEPGGVGVWTKADAASMFDDFVVWTK